MIGNSSLSFTFCCVFISRKQLESLHIIYWYASYRIASLHKCNNCNTRLDFNVAIPIWNWNAYNKYECICLAITCSYVHLLHFRCSVKCTCPDDDDENMISWNVAHVHNLWLLENKNFIIDQRANNFLTLPNGNGNLVQISIFRREIPQQEPYF